MSGFFKTWDDIANYVTNTLGYDYLTNPSSWINAFKEAVGDARYVGDETFYNPTGFNSIDWVNVGKTDIPTIDSGVVQPPSVVNVVTDLTTGGAVVTDAALAVEQTGIFIELSIAGWFATALTGFGLGVVSYEVAPEFWTDMSNYVFGTDLTPSQTEPFLRKKLKTLLSADSLDNKTITYIEEGFLRKTYDFIKNHITDITVRNTFPTAVIDTTTGNITQNNYQTMEYLEDKYVSKAEMQRFVNSCATLLNQRGFTGVQPFDVSDLYDELQENFDLSNYDLITYQCEFDANTWNNNFISTDGQGHVGHFGINAYRLTEEEKSTTTVLKKARKFTDLNTGFLTTIAPNVEKNPAISGSMYVYSPASGEAPVINYDTKQNQTAMYMRSDTDHAHGSLQRYVGLYPDTTDNNYDNLYNGFLSYPERYYFRYSNPVEDDYYIVDPEWEDNVKIIDKNRVPNRNKTPEERYPNKYDKEKKVSQPDKNGNARNTNYLPSTTPIGDENTDRIIKHGVNYNEDSYNESPEDNDSGKNTPNKSTVDDVNNSIEDTVDDYNKSDTSPSSTPQPSPTPLPDYPTNPPTDNDGDSGDTPTVPQIGGLTASGMVSVYNPTKQQLIDFSGWLWSSNFFDNFIKLFANPMDAIIGLHMIYATPISSGSEHIIVGYLDSEVSSKVVTQQYFKVDCGTINIPEYYGNATDYEPYTTIHIYLPFIGIVPLKTNDVLGKQLHLEYGVDVMTGTCLAMLTTIKGDSRIMCYTFAGNCAVQIPISGGNYAQMITGLAGFIVGGVGAIATGNPIMALGAGASFLHGNVNVQHSGSIGSNAGACGTRIPYVLITRKVAYDAQNYQHYYGFPSNNHVTLGTCKGYTQVKSCHVETIGRATDNEKTEIETLLKNGIIIV